MGVLTKSLGFAVVFLILAYTDARPLREQLIERLLREYATASVLS